MLDNFDKILNVEEKKKNSRIAIIKNCIIMMMVMKVSNIIGRTIWIVELNRSA